MVKTKTKRYFFNITLSGIGKNPQEAWEEALEIFGDDSGCYPTDYKCVEED